MPEIPWENTVAYAGPLTSKWRKTMVTISRTMFTTDARTRKMSGVRESPSARMMPEIRL